MRRSVFGFLAITLLAMDGFTPAPDRYPPENVSCPMASTYAEMAFGNFKKAYQAASVDEAKPLIEKGAGEAKQSSAYAVQCNCPTVETYALNAYTFANKASKAGDMKELKKFTKKAMNMALDAVTVAINCK